MSIGLHNLKPTEGSTHRRKRVGRGIGSGHGKTSTRGHKGNKARGQINPNYEGGQPPLHRRLPQVRVFKPVNKKFYALVNLSDIEAAFQAGSVISPETLVASGILRDVRDGLKVLGDGEVTKKFTVSTHKISKGALDKLIAAGGTVELLAVERR